MKRKEANDILSLSDLLLVSILNKIKSPFQKMNTYVHFRLMIVETDNKRRSKYKLSFKKKRYILQLRSP